MFETLDKIMLAGLGALNMTRQKAEKLFDEAVQRGQEVKGSRDKFVDELMDSAKRARASLEETINKQVRSAMTSLNLPTRDDLLRIEGKLDQLLAGKKPPTAKKEEPASK